MNESFEQRLSKVELPTPSLNRDELMYRAGWAAAISSLEKSDATQGENDASATGFASDELEGDQTNRRRSRPITRGFGSAWSVLATCTAIVLAMMYWAEVNSSPESKATAGGVVVAPKAEKSSDDEPVSVSPVAAEPDTNQRHKASLLELVNAWPNHSPLPASALALHADWPQEQALMSAERPQANPVRPLSSRDSRMLLRQIYERDFF